MDLPFYWVDAFTDRVFGGNPAAVVPLEAWPDSALLQSIALQNGLSETAFFVRTGPARAELRWFTPNVEVDLCGHATLATAHVLFRELGQVESPVIFDSKSGPLQVHRIGDRLELNFPSRPAAPCPPTQDLLDGLGLAPLEVLRSERMWLLVYACAAQVADLSPRQEALARVSPGRFIATAPGEDCDYVCRFFAPDAGIPEDPVTGSAQSTLVPYWSRRTGKTEFFSRQISRRGGALWCALADGRVRIAGQAACYLRGRITV